MSTSRRAAFLSLIAACTTTIAVPTVTGATLATSALAAPYKATRAHVMARFRLPKGGYQLAAGLGSLWAVRADQLTGVLILRIDPATNVVHRVGHLPFLGSDIATGFGSLWITDYYGNALWRVSAHGHVQARIGTGLQPEAVHMAFGSVWVANHHGASVTRVDPATNSVTATDSAGDPKEFRSGPQGITDDGVRLYVGSSNLQVLQSIDPATDTTSTPAGPTDDAFCGKLTAAQGAIWSADHCSDALYQHAPDGTIISRTDYSATGAQVQDTTVTGRHLWVAVDKQFDQNTLTGTGGVLEERDPVTGSVLRTISVGGDISQVTSGFGSLWTFDANTHTVRRIRSI